MTAADVLAAKGKGAAVVWGTATAVGAMGAAMGAEAANPPDDFAGRYRRWRRAYYARFPAFWATLPGESVEEYAVYGALAISRRQASALRTAAARLYPLLTRLAAALQHTDDATLLRLGLPAATLPYARVVLPQMAAVMCGRFEFAMTVGGPKLLEFNAETPTFVVELFHMNGQVCADFGLADPNHGCEAQLAGALHNAITAGVAWLAPAPVAAPSVVFTSYAHLREERATTEYYQSLLDGERPYRLAYAGLDELRVTPDGLTTADGVRVDVLYKLYPTEHLVEDEAPDGTPVGLALMDLVRQRRLAIINPPIAFVLQCKALMALLWALYLTQDALFTPAEHQWLARYLLPTYLEAVDAAGQPLFAGRYVVKPVYGREGLSVTIRDAHTVIERSAGDLYDAQVMVHQQFVSLPTTTLQTEIGRTEVSLVHNCFVVGGQPSAIGVRAARKLIFDDASYFVPVCYPTGGQS
ncbi:MAG: glutathionylspermidine synthase family protein [Ktedonobacterales bacterium]|nr:glutathionylspermidine synthase family protein [Ktedonobacterales bacterium]